MSRVDRTVRERKRRHRRRAARGIIPLVGVEVDEVAFLDALINAGRITEDSALDRAAIVAATSRLLSDFSAGRIRWRE